MSRLPVNVLTGFLGSGKTTLLQRMLASEDLADTAVLVNEFGEVGLDHHLLRRVEGDIVLLKSGCVCCTIREDLGSAIRDLYSMRSRGVVPPFQRLAIETTGLADPVPILSTVMGEPVIRHHFRLGNVVVTIDAVNGGFHLDRQPESVRQIAVADRIVLTKTDIAEPHEVERLVGRVRAINHAAPIDLAGDPNLDIGGLLSSDPYDVGSRGQVVADWLRLAGEEREHHHDHSHGHDRNRHDAAIQTFSVTLDEPLDWTAFGIWFSMMLNRHGDDLLRVKGILNLRGGDAPVVINGVQHVIHPPIHLDAWPDGDRRSRIVFIVRGLERERIEASLRAFLGLSAL
ncbi:hypothetical protein N825_09155 [Skermanella stibiiresistens SB22]|uniref:CobW C-terminal domain-containing protein n=1 Tax=Skermanella stibiiresistens SB22 TaxID=1385369 RepID=W9GZ60_9PROT|nr:GTP-binding protein [Skermanella stibiiresistens]EWY37737.1 hypothetical protein N825_09155 [Skermanella stibiiresistens SB22]